MSKLKHFLGCIREYKTSTILTILLVVGEAAIEVTIPFITADLINKINGGINMSQPRELFSSYWRFFLYASED